MLIGVIGAWWQVKRENVHLAGHGPKRGGGPGPALPSPVTVLVCGLVPMLAEEAATTVNRCLRRLSNALADRRVLPGAVSMVG